jgi:hypothetical protein
MKYTIILMIMFGFAISASAQTEIDEYNCVQCVKTEPTGYAASAIGQKTLASGDGSLAAGYLSEATGLYSMALGQECKSTGQGSFSTGYKSYAIGTTSYAIGKYCVAEGQRAFVLGNYSFASHDNAFAIGSKVKANDNYAFVIGRGTTTDYLTNDINESLMIGFNSIFPTLFVSSSNLNQTGKIGIGNITAPEAKLHIKADSDEDASLYLQPTHSSYYARFFLGDFEHSISARQGQDMVFQTEVERDFVFSNGDLRIGNNYQIETGTVINTSTTGLQLFDNSNSGITINNNGNVGVGTTNPTSQLNVEGASGYDGSLVHFHQESQGGAGKTLYVTNSPGNVGTLAKFDNDGLGPTAVFTGGYVGIGIEDPSYPLEINGSVNIASGQLYKNGQLMKSGVWDENGDDIFYNNGRVGIGITDPKGHLDIQSSWGDWATFTTINNDFWRIHNNQTQDVLSFGYEEYASGDQKWILSMNNQGQVGIGTSTHEDAEAKLTVKGKIHAQEVKITSSAGADFVFEESYILPELNEVEAYVRQNKHLPDIPSEKEMQENGVDLGTFQIKLLQKVEELTLYIIELEKELDQVKNSLSINQ